MVKCLGTAPPKVHSHASPKEQVTLITGHSVGGYLQLPSLGVSAFRWRVEIHLDFHAVRGRVRGVREGAYEQEIRVLSGHGEIGEPRLTREFLASATGARSVSICFFEIYERREMLEAVPAIEREERVCFTAEGLRRSGDLTALVCYLLTQRVFKEQSLVRL